jgi:phospholipase C
VFGVQEQTDVQVAPMNGFVANAETHEKGWGEKIMSCFNPETVPVISTLATEFALFDKWFASVPGLHIILES